MDWIRSPFEVPIPTQRDAEPVEPLGALGRVRVEVASRMKESVATGPVLNAGPMAASTTTVKAAVADIILLRACILELVSE